MIVLLAFTSMLKSLHYLYTIINITDSFLLPKSLICFRENLQLHSIGLIRLNEDGTPVINRFGRRIANYEQVSGSVTFYKHSLNPKQNDLLQTTSSLLFLGFGVHTETYFHCCQDLDWHTALLPKGQL